MVDAGVIVLDEAQLIPEANGDVKLVLWVLAHMVFAACRGLCRYRRAARATSLVVTSRLILADDRLILVDDRLILVDDCLILDNHLNLVDDSQRRLADCTPLRLVHEAGRAGLGGLGLVVNRLLQLCMQLLPHLAVAYAVAIINQLNASPKAYGCSAYLRIRQPDGSFSVSFVASKGRVAPLRQQLTLPRLELLACVMAAEMVQYVLSALRLPESTRFSCWSDSMIALGWLRGRPERWKTYVANRVKVREKRLQKFWNVWSQEYVRSLPLSVRKFRSQGYGRLGSVLYNKVCGFRMQVTKVTECVLHKIYK
ncbi:hypothetical protein FJT64_002363 [Amphibalanus amphitrite]|uniref:Uncharacterized protein n=1 Tax=Amphibalanus amphitrite TaxID=1232801 RepID=A0A6A4WKV4_AMPAM|nr:hypothetical protein FJT64_002363 [Amphibalanus amphitrite]